MIRSLRLNCRRVQWSRFSRPAIWARALPCAAMASFHTSPALLSAENEGTGKQNIDPKACNDSSSHRMDTPKEVMVLPLLKRPLFPGIVAPVVVPNEPFSAALHAIREQMPISIGLFLAKDPKRNTGFTKLDHIHRVGLLAQVMRVFPHRQGMSQVVLVGLHRIKASALAKGEEGAPFTVAVDALEDEPYDCEDDEIKAYSNEIIATVRELMKLNPMFKDQYSVVVEQVDLAMPSDLADCIAGLANSEAKAAQAVLESLDVRERMKKALELLKKEVDYGEIQAKIHQKMDGSMNKNHRRFVLLEQLKTIKRELGMEHDEKDALITKFQNRINDRDIPEAPLTVINEELNKLGGLEPSSSEFNVTRNYLDWLTVLPWSDTTEELYDLTKAHQVLDEDHFGLEDIKQRILELIAVGALKGSVNGKILCLVGPPGVGKTSIGKSIARALERKFYRFSVGGMTDVAEIKGHRRTYVGAMPGKPIQAMKLTQAMNPVLLIDEIDKIGRGVNGDPGSSLLEVLDPEQNTNFLDHYLDVPFDLSKVLFLTTANSLSTIPRPLLDRMEVLELTGYVTDEKVAIAKKYLIPRAMQECGLHENDVSISDDAIVALVSSYCREAGVRNLQKQLEKILRKLSFKFASGEVEKFTVTKSNLDSFVGKPVFTSDRYHDRTPPGVVMGLAWSSMGGSTMYIETIAISSDKETGGRLNTTGSMGEVMTESTNIAHSFAKSFLAQVDPKNNFFKGKNLHMHVPQGATPKEGPSAGCAMVTSLLSLAMDKPVPSHLAMTGEVTLTGKVLRIGGVKEKTMAARRSGATCLIFPAENQADFEELADYIREGIEVHFVSDYSQIYDIAFETLPARPQLANMKPASP